MPTAPLAEQHRIVDYLDKAQTLISELERAQERTEAEIGALEQSIRAQAFRREL